MATKGNIARSGAMGKSFYQSTKSKRTRNRRLEGKTTDPQKPHEHDRTRRPEPKTTRDQKPQNDPHKNHKRSTKTKNAQSGL